MSRENLPSLQARGDLRPLGLRIYELVTTVIPLIVSDAAISEAARAVGRNRFIAPFRNQASVGRPAAVAQ
jgi:hypothetical protein